ncbi:hypothetical protein FS842_011510, partial [Serendipita sp. 407]
MTTSTSAISLTEDDQNLRDKRKRLLGVARVLSGNGSVQNPTSKSLEDVLKSRLVQVYDLDIADLAIPKECLDGKDLQALERLTGNVALIVLQQFHSIQASLED